MSGMTILEYRGINKGSLLGFAKVEMSSGMVLNDVGIFSGRDGPWASPPSKPRINRDGQVVKDQNGKGKYERIIEFASKEIQERWSAAVIAAMQEAYPDVFGS